MKSKKKLGIVGGMGSRAASMLFKKIIDASPAITDQEFIEILLHNNSAVPDRTQSIVYGEASPIPEILRSLELFNRNDVDIVVLACITSHYFYDQFQLASKAEILHPISLVKKYILENHSTVRKIGVLATTGTFKTHLFQNEFKDSGIEIVKLNEEDQERLFMKSVYMKNGLKSSEISEKAFQLFEETLPKLMDQGAELFVGGCTEVQIAFANSESQLPYVDTMDVITKEVIRRCYSTRNELVGEVS